MKSPWGVGNQSRIRASGWCTTFMHKSFEVVGCLCSLFIKGLI